MSAQSRSLLADAADGIRAQVRNAWHVVLDRGPNQLQFWLIALAVGIAGGAAALFFRKGIEALQSWLYRTDDITYLHSWVGNLPWYWVLCIPVLGGLAVGLILHLFTPDGRVRSVADVIQGAALNDGRVEGRAGLASAAASLITLGTGGSSGREGPVVHLAAVISSRVLHWLKADGVTGRDLLGCAVAAAVSASFNAPIAGALFALEVVLRHFAIHAFAPIVIASVAGTVINRLEFGGVTEFTLPDASILQFYQELPAFLILGGVCGIAAGILMRAIFAAEDVATHVQSRLSIPRWLRPALAGALLGLIAIPFPHIIGVGYETTSLALTGRIGLWDAIVFTVIKTVAVAVTIGGRMGGGVFSPALMVGALTGLAFGLVATSIFPEVSGSSSLYALAGMGGVAAAVLGAPISTTLIVFELTGDWATGLAVMVTVSISTSVGTRLVDRSFFLTQLERRGVHVAAGPQAYLLALFRVSEVMRPRGGERTASDAACWEMIEAGDYVDAQATLETALPAFDRTGAVFLPVVQIRRADQPPDLLGALYHVDALRAYNRALAATAAEEHS
ncbi:voltage-gated chloride channel family protein [Pseudooceanicola batsensis HTCC2597]|uniref:Voltage-gated chloride channel family protein n=1 Tax=Pseudooceanicola batsensis (strain ATCC BAA-863 / DSM 15984 / KCTC 12145 / HTCC2597) TaxID=252305 RepID=A3TZD0_PSEBH|nr:chloride channel protein [Pseudooceanicola batsensis]EAQ02948.1 voltage-gated chloride channel family protein [Pseudooceanicola batsensis HTCC2597]